MTILFFSHQSASVTDTLRTAALIGQRGESLASEAEASAIVCTTLKGDSVRNASQAFTEIPTDRTPPPTPANVSCTHILLNYSGRQTFRSTVGAINFIRDRQMFQM